MKKLIGLFALMFTGILFAQDGPPAELNTLFMIIGPFLASYVEKYPLLGSIISIMVMSRLVIKPLMSALITINKDAEIKFLDGVAELSDNKIYKTVSFVLDWLLSLKLPKKKK